MEKLKKQTHQWLTQANPSLDNLDEIWPHMKRLLDIAEEKTQFLGPEMSNIVDSSIQYKMSNLLSITTLTIDI